MIVGLHCRQQAEIILTMGHFWNPLISSNVDTFDTPPLEETKKLDIPVLTSGLKQTSHISKSSMETHYDHHYY